MNPTIHQWDDIWFAAETWPINEVVMGFRAYRIIGRSKDETLFYLKGWTSSADSTEKMADAQVYVEGDIKWDGCSNVTFTEQENAMLHFCGLHGIMEVGNLFKRLYGVAADLMPEHRADVLG